MFAHHNVFNSGNDWRYMCRRHNRILRLAVLCRLCPCAGGGLCEYETLFCGVGLRFNGRHNMNCCFDDFFNGFCRSFLFFAAWIAGVSTAAGVGVGPGFFSLRLSLDGFDGCRNVLFFNRFYCFFNSCRSLNGLSTFYPVKRCFPSKPCEYVRFFQAFSVFFRQRPDERQEHSWLFSTVSFWRLSSVLSRFYLTRLFGRALNFFLFGDSRRVLR